ncbi:MAG: hypothetical protein PHY72_01865 [Candidatus Pacebacteria bacterium]|nr:hypothetical protein [Candidatus Paceibacterota bacterium]
MNQARNICNLLKKWRITASAPYRVDVGGTWDLKAFALPYERIKPTTVNFALSMRTKVELLPFMDGWVKVSDKYTEEAYAWEGIPFDTNFRLIFAIISYFHLHGLEIKLSYDAPPKSGLGGSGVLAVCTVGALDKAQDLLEPNTPTLSKVQIVHIAHNIEDGLRFSYTGLQDQCAAAYGGVNKWIWRYASMDGKFERHEVLPEEHHAEIASRLLVAYVGESHVSSDVNKEQVASFHSGKTRQKWLRINDIASEFADAIAILDWEKVVALVQEENDIRLSMIPCRITPIGERLQTIAQEIGGGFGITGAGGGGCVWAICPKPEQTSELRSRWQELLKNVPNGKVLDVGIDNQGMIVEAEEA